MEQHLTGSPDRSCADRGALARGSDLTDQERKELKGCITNSVTPIVGCCIQLLMGLMIVGITWFLCWYFGGWSIFTH